MDFGRVEREVLRDLEGEGEGAALVHAFVGLDEDFEVQHVVGVFELGPHRVAVGQLGEVCR